MAAVTSRVSAFWGAFLNLLLACIAGLGFTAPARLRAAAAATAASAPVAPAATLAAAPAARTRALPPPHAAVPAQGAAAPARTAAVPQQAAASAAAAAAVPEPRSARPTARPGARSAAKSAARPTARAEKKRRPAAPPAPSYAGAFMPSPRSSRRDRSLPPTMKQRISAEAHGASPSARSVAVPADGCVGALAVPTAATTSGRGEVRIPAARRRDRVLLCG